MVKIIWIWICEYVANNPGVKFGHVLRLLGDWGSTYHKYFFRFLLSLTLSYGLPKPSMQPTKGRFHLTFLAEMRFPIPFYLLSSLLRPSSAPLRPVWHPLGLRTSHQGSPRVCQTGLREAWARCKGGRMGNLILARKVGWNLPWVGSVEGSGSP